jgi:hypothetical protein
MKIGFDYWNVLSHHPDYFGELIPLMLAAGHEVHVISAIGRKRSGTIADEVEDLGIAVTAVHELVFSRPGESPALKTARCLELGVTVFYDDRDDVCRAMTTAGILALRVTRPDRRRDTAAERDRAEQDIERERAMTRRAMQMYGPALAELREYDE